MTSTPPNEPLEAFPIPDGAIVLAPSDQQLTPRASVIQALQQAMSERRFTLPLGPETALLDHNRLVSLNHFAVQLNLAGLMADEISIDLSPWRADQNAPQLSMAALVDSENDVVVVQGVLTNEEMQELVKGNDLSAEDLTLETDCFKGGLDRLFTLVQLLEPSAIPRRALSTSLQRLLSSVILIGDWIQGQVDDTLTAYGARLQPITAAPGLRPLKNKKHILGDFLEGGAGRHDNGPRSSGALPLPTKLGRDCRGPRVELPQALDNR